MKARKKSFARTAEQVRPLVEGRGACLATDEIMVKGRRVGHAYREAPDNDVDSGWRFTAGDESDEYMDDADNHGVYDVNTVANYDPEIIPLLDAEPGSAFVRDTQSDEFVCVRQPEGAAPMVEGAYAMTDTWAITLPPGRFRRRFEEGSLVLWRPGLTAWIRVWNNTHNESAAKRAADVRTDSSPQAFDVLDEQAGELLRYAYRLTEPSADQRVAAFYGFAFGRSGHVQMAVYFDDHRDLESALAMWRGLHER
jgi:hypothetical protein